MSSLPEQRPAYRRPITVEIPAPWTPEQALAVYELLDELRERIWEIYGFRLQDLLREQQQPLSLAMDSVPPANFDGGNRNEGNFVQRVLAGCPGGSRVSPIGPILPADCRSGEGSGVGTAMHADLRGLSSTVQRRQPLRHDGG
jgi:hypothetical protein